MAIQSNKIKSAIMEFRNGSEVPVEKYINLPITWEPVLDETQDTAEMVRKDGFATWSHNIELVDEVKKLEQEPVDNLTFRNAIPRVYDEEAGNKWYFKNSTGEYYFWEIEYDQEQTNDWKPPSIQAVYPEGIIAISDNASTFNTAKYSLITGILTYLLSLELKVTYPSGKEVLFSSNISDVRRGEKYKDTIYQIVADQTGDYHLELTEKWHYYCPPSGDISQGTYMPAVDLDYTTSIESWIFAGNVEENPAKVYSIKDVIDRVLSVTPLRTTRNENKYRFRGDAEEYATEESPEFTFTGKHLFEVMLDIASYKKTFPALYKNEIYFRPFWNGVMLTSDDLPPPYKAIMNSAIDQYCDNIESYVENMVCINDSTVGTIIEPYKGGYISARSGGGSEISENTAVIPTQSPIYQVTKLNMGKTNGVDIGDIQAYIYEQEDYEALSDTSAAYPNSKGYALKYTRHEQNFTELAHRIDGGNGIANALKLPALANITRAKKRGTVGTNLETYIKGLLGVSNGNSFADLLFQPSYIPIVNARVRQYKPLRGQGYEATLFYNQQSEVVDSEAFGEHVKGLVQKLGNHTEIRVYRFERIDDVPTVGTLIDEKSVYDVAMTIFENHVDATICLVDYAELSTYIGVKNEIKTSDISTTKWCNRFINWEEFLVFTHNDIQGSAVSITSDALNGIFSFTAADPLTCAMFTSYTDGGDSIMTAFAPIKHLAIGNSIYFQWEMLDNFAVGYQSEEAPQGATSVLSGTKYNRAQKAVPYCDVYGKMETLDFKLLKEGPTVDNSNWILPSDFISWRVDEENELFCLEIKKALPCYTIAYFQGPVIDPYGWGVPNIVLAPGETSATYSWGWSTEETTFNTAYIDKSTEERKALADDYIQKEIAHAYPEKPSELSFQPLRYSYSRVKSTFDVTDLLIKKNSAEALKFAAQYHFQQDWREFVIGSGMSNFCSLVGGACTQLQMFISALPINRFERHVNLDDADKYLVLDELPTFTVDEENKRVEITLPSSVNDYIDVTKSWGLVGIDKNGNRQLIFGENKNAKNEAFLTTIYLVPMQKNNEPQARATYTLSLADTSSHESNILFSIYVDGVFYGQSGNFELPRDAEVTVKNNWVRGFYFVVDGTRTWGAYQKSFTFKITKDMTYYVWDTYVDPSEPMPV